MANNRCFDTFIPLSNSSDYLNTTRQKTLFKEVNYNVKNFNTANPKKKNGFSYNNKFSVRKTNNDKGCLVSAKDYNLLLDITKGKTITANQNISCNGNTDIKMNAPIFDAWSGNLYSVNYSEHGVGSILQFDQTNCVYDVDPNNELFYQPCPSTELSGIPPEWFNVVDISFNNTAYYIEANRAQLLNGFNYPEQVVFGAN